MAISISAQDKKWQAQNDAHTLAEAQTIMSDKTRLNAAAKQAVKMAKNSEKKTVAMKKVATKVQTKATPKPKAKASGKKK